jgi:hypothetical protein
MIMRSSKTLVVRLYWQLVVMLLLALLIHEPSNKLVHGQLEAVGAVLSVVPVTSILATAGLVGVKLAALSRLLDILGYDRAYLAQNLGTGTAAAPIGLQTRYAYMFPYVPGLNISVKGDDSIGMPKETLAEMDENGAKVTPTTSGSGGTGDSSSGGGGGQANRKVYPSMSLPADYEHQRRPFRGSEALRDIFRKAGLQANIPTTTQQLQLQQQFNLPPQGKDQNELVQHQPLNVHHLSTPSNLNDNDPNRNDAQQLHSHVLQQPTYKDQLPTTNDNNNNQQQQQQQQPPPPPPPPQQQPQPPPPSPQQLLPPPNQQQPHPQQPPPAQNNADQSANKPSLSNSQQQPTSTSNQSPTGGVLAAAATATQVNMPHPHHNINAFARRPPANPPLVSAGDASAGVLRGLLANADETPAELFGVRPLDTGERHQAPANRPSLSSVHYDQHAVIPQRDFFSLMARRRPPGGFNAANGHQLQQQQHQQQQQQQQHQVALNMGHLSRPSSIVGPADPPDSLAPIQAVQLIPALADRRPAQFINSAAAVPESFKPGRHPELMMQLMGAQRSDRWQLHRGPPPLPSHNFEQALPPPLPPHPTVASQGAGFSPIPNEMTTTNFFPRPFDIDDPPTLFGDRSNELDRTQPNRRRRKRSAIQQQQQQQHRSRLRHFQIQF